MVSTSRRDEVMKLRETGLTNPEIGRRLGISRQRVWRIVKGKPTQRPAPDSKPMLRISDVALLLGLHPNTVRRWSNWGMLKSYRIGSRGDRRFRWEDVDRFLNSGGKSGAKLNNLKNRGHRMRGLGR